MILNRQHQRGFTLLELIISIVLTGIVLVLLYSGMRLGVRSWQKGEEKANQTNQMRLMENFLRQRFLRSLPGYIQDAQGRRVAFSGETDRVRWVAPMLEYLDMGGLYFLQLQWLEKPNQGGVLSLQWTPYRPSDGGFDKVDSSIVEEKILLKGVQVFKMSYFGGYEKDREPRWYDQWPSERIRPELVRLQLTWNHREWPALVVPLVN